MSTLNEFIDYIKNKNMGAPFEADLIEIITTSFEAGAADMQERCAREVEPRVPRPCDCERCSCGNYGDAEAVAGWDADAYAAKIIRALPVIATEGGTKA